MVDNITVTPGSGVSIAADDIGGGVLAQRVKIVTGPDGVGNDLAAGQTTKANSLPVTLASDQDTLPVNQTSSSYGSTVTITRPNDTTAYSVNDVVGGVLTLTLSNPFGSIPTNSAVIINGASLEYDVTAVPSGMSSFRLYLYVATPPSALADNAPWDLASGDRAAFHGFIDIGSPADLGSTLYVELTSINKQVRLATGSSALYGYLVSSGGFVPGSADVFKVKIHTLIV